MERGYRWDREEAVSESLLSIGDRHGTDKFGKLGYHHFYEKHLGHLRGREFMLLEIGVYHGASLRTWEEYFPKATIIGLDCDRACASIPFERAKVVFGSQSDPACLASIAALASGFDVVIDDGSHMMGDQQASFKALFPRLHSGGFYVMEDLHTSYWNDYGGGPCDKPGTTIGMLKFVVDDVNQDIHKGAQKAPAPIKAMHFYAGITFIERG